MNTAPVKPTPLQNITNIPAAAPGLPIPQPTPPQPNLWPRVPSGPALSSNAPGGAIFQSEPQYSGAKPGRPAAAGQPLVWDEQQLLDSSRKLEAGIEGKEAEARDQALVDVFKEFRQVRVNLPAPWLTGEEAVQQSLKKLDLNYIDLVCAPIRPEIRGSNAHGYRFADSTVQIAGALENFNLLATTEGSEIQLGLSITAASRCPSMVMLDCAYTSLRDALRKDKVVARLSIDSLQSTKDGTRAEDVLSVLKSHPSLQQLQLRNTVIDDAMASYLISLTRTVPNLQCLDLAGNEITAQAREILSRASQKVVVILPQPSCA